MRIKGTGNVGIGVDPTQKLDVAGNVKFTGALLPNNVAGTSGQVLTSAGAGLPPTWNTPSGSTLISNAGTNNIFVGQNTGGSAANDNAFLGYNAGNATTLAGVFNTFIGSGTGRVNTSGTYNTYVGAVAGYNSTTAQWNVFIGGNAGFNLATGNLNTFVGYNAGANGTGGISNTFIGNKAGESAAGTNYNTFLGEHDGEITTGNENTFVGRQSGDNNTSGSQNTYLGSQSRGVVTLTNATAIGYRAYVGANNSLVLGSINGVNGAGANTNVGIGTTTPTTEFHVTHGNGSPATGNGLTIQNVGASNQNFALFVSNSTGNLNLYDNTTFVGGFAQVTGTYTPISDRRFKKNIVTIEEVLPKLSLINIRRYHFKKQQDNEPTNIGVIAQELKEIYPELVHYSPESDRYTVDYQSMGPIAIKAIQEQQLMIKKLEKKVQELEGNLSAEKTEKAELKAQLNELTTNMTKVMQALGLDTSARKD